MGQEVAAGAGELLGLQKLCDPMMSWRCHLDSVFSVFPVFGVSVADQALEPWYLGTGDTSWLSWDEGRCGGAVRHCQPWQHPGCPLGQAPVALGALLCWRCGAQGCLAGTVGSSGARLVRGAQGNGRNRNSGIHKAKLEKVLCIGQEKESLGHPGEKFGAGKKERAVGALWVHCRGMGAVSMGWGGEAGVCVCVCACVCAGD